MNETITITSTDIIEELREELASLLEEAPNRTDYEHYINECAEQALQEDEDDVEILEDLIEKLKDL